MVRISALVLAMLLATASAATSADAQPQTGNRANGRDYQPSQGEVLPREKAAGVAPDSQQQQESDRALEQVDKNLLKSEGKSTASVPPIASH